jgi:pentatricopeptide repeat protein
MKSIEIGQIKGKFNNTSFRFAFNVDGEFAIPEYFKAGDVQEAWREFQEMAQRQDCSIVSNKIVERLTEGLNTVEEVMGE